MPNWSRFTPADFEYDFDNDELDVHRITFNEAIECFSLILKFGGTNRTKIVTN
ncbi:MAG: hypothetical protein U0X87_05010 [Anaerolineales bacterium]